MILVVTFSASWAESFSAPMAHGETCDFDSYMRSRRQSASSWLTVSYTLILSWQQTRCFLIFAAATNWLEPNHYQLQNWHNRNFKYKQKSNVFQEDEQNKLCQMLQFYFFWVIFLGTWEVVFSLWTLFHGLYLHYPHLKGAKLNRYNLTYNPNCQIWGWVR